MIPLSATVSRNRVGVGGWGGTVVTNAFHSYNAKKKSEKSECHTKCLHHKSMRPMADSEVPLAFNSTLFHSPRTFIHARIQRSGYLGSGRLPPAWKSTKL